MSSKLKNKYFLLVLGIFLSGFILGGSNLSKSTDVKGVQESITTIPTIQPTATPTYTPTPTPTPEPTSTPVQTLKPVIYVAPTIVIQTAQPTAGQSGGLDDNDYYTNVDGNKVHSPANSVDGSVLAGATARCKDGTYSFSQHRSGTCSHHGGVAQWL